MQFGKPLLFASSMFLAMTSTAALGAPRFHRGPTSPHLFRSRSQTAKPQPKKTAHIEAERASEIQTALIRTGYLTAPATGIWDAQTQAAMEKLQADNGWQTKLVPDARAIIKLGLGSGHASPSEFSKAPLESGDGVPSPAEVPAALPTDH